MAAAVSRKKFVTSCTVNFKTMDFEVRMAQSKSAMWHFEAQNPDKTKTYVVMCVPEIKKGRSLIKAAFKKAPEGKRFVVICDKYDDKDVQESEKNGYTLVTLQEINRFGVEMLEIKERESLDNAA